MKVLVGNVVSGKGDFAQWIEKLQYYYYQKTKLNFFPGTLNIELDRPYRVAKNSLCLHADEYGGEVSIYLFPCAILEDSAYILRTERNELGIGDRPLTIIK